MNPRGDLDAYIVRGRCVAAKGRERWSVKWEGTPPGGVNSRYPAALEPARRETMPDVWAGLNPPYKTIVADPPWTYRQQRILTTAKGAATRPEAAQRYSVLTTADIGYLPVVRLASEDAHCYLWTTNPKLPEAFGVLAAWGFEYATCLTWRKLGTLGMGFYFRGDTEHVLFGVRGKLPIPPRQRERNWFEAPKTGHSRKPPAFLDLVERVSPGPYVELFARQPRFGWDSWGWGYEASGEESDAHE